MKKQASELLTRGVAKVIPKDLAEQKLASGKKLRVYWGIDPTGSKIHLGHTVQLRKMQQFADAGHEVIMVIGSFTAMIGDPTDREAERQPLSKEQVKANFQTYKTQAAKVLDFSKVQIRFNHEWLEKLSAVDMVHLASKFTVQRMMERDMFEKRWEEGRPISSHEFMYPLFVGYDSVFLDVDCELGGTDQEFNMLAGRHLQQVMGKREKFILTTPLLEGTDGRKMSKSYENCVYIDDASNDMFGKLMSIKDELITRYMEFCTDIPMVEIQETEKAMKKGANPRDFKVQLATEIVRMYHGEKAAAEAPEAFINQFKRGEVPEEIPQHKAKKGALLIDVLVDAKLVESKGEAKRLIQQKGVHMNDNVVEAMDAKAEEGIVKVGKRKFLKTFFENN